MRQDYAAAVASSPGSGLPMTRLLELVGVWDRGMVCTPGSRSYRCVMTRVQKPDVFTAVNRHYDLRGMNGSWGFILLAEL